MEVEGNDLSNFTGARDGHAALDDRIEHVGVNDAQNCSGGIGRGDHAFALLRRFCHGLFHQDMRACLERLNREVRVRCGRSEHMHGIDAGCQQLRETAVCMRQLKQLCDSLRAVQVDICYAANLDRRNAAERAKMVPAGVTCADNSNSDFFHDSGDRH